MQEPIMMSKQSNSVPVLDGILLRGYQKKLKTMKKKYFVLYKDTSSNCARLEYFDNEKKFKSGTTPKRIITLKNCFNINRRLDTKHDYVIALSTKDGGFGIVLESETEMVKWLEVLLTLQRIEDSICEQPRTFFEHVWQVVVQRRGFAEEKGIVGTYHACLTPKSLTFLRIGLEKTSENRIQSIEFLLTTIRRCGDSQCFFYMEVGRQSIIGPGELWMETEDSMIAQNMHNMILSAMSSRNEAVIDPMRKRSSSANEASKPASMLLRKQTQPETKPNNASSQTGLIYGRERCDSLPSSRNRFTNDGTNQCNYNQPLRNVLTHGHRSQSLHHRHSNSPPVSSTFPCSESEESSLSIDEQDDNVGPYRFSSRSSDGVIPEENSDEIISADNKCTVGDIVGSYLNKTEYDKNRVPDNYNVFESGKSNTLLSEIIEFPKHIRSICSNRILKTQDNNDDNYILMGPTCADSKILKNYYKDPADLDRFSSLCIANHVDKQNLNFEEYSDHLNTQTIKGDKISTYERPTRAYSIGSRLEHNRLKIRLSVSEADQTMSRVRAFSVGSRAKVPHCDLQRSLLNYKSSIEPNSNGSNINIQNLTETAVYAHGLNLKSNRDKKSTSAPLLFHKSQTSGDRMGDLMEIDFSKNPNIHRTFTTSSAKVFPISMSVPVSNMDEMENYKTLISNSFAKTGISSNNYTSLKKSKNTDNGYLEMKPVSHTLNPICVSNSNITNSNYSKQIENNSMTSKSLHDNILFENKNTAITSHEINDNPEFCTHATVDLLQDKDNSKNYNTSESLDPNTCLFTDEETNEKAHIFGLMHSSKINENIKSVVSVNNNKEIFGTLHVTNKDKIEDQNLKTNLHYRLYGETTEPEVEILNTDSDQLNASVFKKNFKELSLKIPEKLQNMNDSGYEILQIKSDSLLQSNEIFQRPNVNKTALQPYSHTSLNRPNSAHSVDLHNSIYRPLSISDSLYCVGSKTVDNVSSKKQLLNTSRPPFLSTERELCYACLDLPHCSSEKKKSMEIPTKPVNSKESSTLCTPSKINNSQTTFTYAKINFEQCDSSNNIPTKLFHSS